MFNLFRKKREKISSVTIEDKIIKRDENGSLFIFPTSSEGIVEIISKNSLKNYIK